MSAEPEVQGSERTPQENLAAILDGGACKLYVCPLCLDTSTNAVLCYGREGEPPHREVDVLRVGVWRDPKAEEA